MATADPQAVPTLTEAQQQFIEERAEFYNIEQQAFADISGRPSLQEGISTAQLTRAGLAATKAAMERILQPSSLVLKPLLLLGTRQEASAKLPALPWKPPPELPHQPLNFSGI